jgi:hypothetical protein
MGRPASLRTLSRRRGHLAGDTLPPSPLPDAELLRREFIPFIDAIDQIVGRDARIDLGRTYSFLAGWREGLTPRQAIAEAIEWMCARPCERVR